MPRNICAETRWLGHFSGFYVPGCACSPCWVCWGILGCRIPLLTKNLAPMILIQSTGGLEECLQLPLLSSAFVASVHRDNPSHMAHATIAVLNLGPEGLSWNRIQSTKHFRVIQFIFVETNQFNELIAIQTWFWRCKHTASARAWLLEANAES